MITLGFWSLVENEWIVLTRHFMVSLAEIVTAVVNKWLGFL